MEGRGPVLECEYQMRREELRVLSDILKELSEVGKSVRLVGETLSRLENLLTVRPVGSSDTRE